MNATKIINLGKAEVQLDLDTKFAFFTVMLNCKPLEVCTPDNLIAARDRVDSLTNYLVAEGFMPDPKEDPDWQFCVASIGIQPQI